MVSAATAATLDLEVSSQSHNVNEKELSYRKQIVRQLHHTQYVEGIYRLKYYTVTLKCRLRVTQSHRKRYRCICIDHTRLTISRVM